MNPSIQTILVPNGAEHRAVCRGLRRALNPPTVFSVPAGPAPLIQHLEELHRAGCLYQKQSILVMGLCGGLAADLAVSDTVLYQTCGNTWDAGSSIDCDRVLIAHLYDQLAGRVSLVTGVTSDRVISLPIEKRHLAQQFSADVVDMESFAALRLLTKIGTSVAILRVLSDDSHHTIPDLAAAFSPTGSLRPLPVAGAMLRQPRAAIQLIQGSLKGLQVLQAITATLFTPKAN